MSNTACDTYKAVIALNNTAVQLMQRRLFPEGLITMKDGLRLMRNAFFSDGSSVPQPDEVNQALQAAWRRSSKQGDDAVPDDATKVVMISDIDNPYCVYTTLAQNPGIIHCVRIDAHEDFCDLNADRLEIESAFMMYNYAIAHLFVSPSNAVVGCPNDYVSTSYQLLELADSISMVHLNDSEFIDASTNALLVSTLINVTLHRLSAQFDISCTKSGEHLKDLISTITYREAMFPQYKFSAAAVA